MTTRKNLTEQARAEQRHRLAASKNDVHKTAIVSIGDRDPKTGLFAVKTGDGVEGLGEKQFNSSLPNGNQVLGVPQSAGGWLLDERDVQPIKPTVKPSTSGKVKVLFSVVEGNDRVFYLWGDRPKPKRIFAITKDSRVMTAKIDNLGDGDRWIVGLQWESTTEFSLDQSGFPYPAIHTQVFSNNKIWSETVEHANASEQGGRHASAGTFRYMGYGFWLTFSGGVPGGSASPSIQPATNVFYQGEKKTLLGNNLISSGDSVESDSYWTLVLPVSLTQTRTVAYRHYVNNAASPSIDFYTGTYLRPVLFGSRVGYYEYFEGAGPYSLRQHKLATIGNDADELFADLAIDDFPFKMEYANSLPNINSDDGTGHLIRNRYFSLVTGYLFQKGLYFNAFFNSSNQWEWEVRTIGNPTTKKTFKTKVQCKLDPIAIGAQPTFINQTLSVNVHSASYHP